MKKDKLLLLISILILSFLVAGCGISKEVVKVTSFDGMELVISRTGDGNTIENYYVDNNDFTEDGLKQVLNLNLKSGDLIMVEYNSKYSIGQIKNITLSKQTK